MYIFNKVRTVWQHVIYTKKRNQSMLQDSVDEK